MLTLMGIVSLLFVFSQSIIGVVADTPLLYANGTTQVQLNNKTSI